MTEQETVMLPPGFTLRIEWRVVGTDDYQAHTGDALDDEEHARRWAAHCNGAGGDEHDPNTYLINHRPFRVERREIIEHTGDWETPSPVTPYSEVSHLSGSALDQHRYDVNAAVVDDVYPGFREALPHTLAILRERGPICDTCLTPAIWSEGLGWCHVENGRNVLPDQDPADHRPDMTTWNAL